MADEHIGYLVAGMRLDDAQYRTDVKAAITDTSNRLRNAQGQFVAKPRFLYRAMVEDAEFAAKKLEQQGKRVRNAFDTSSASHSLRVLSGSLHLVTGETGFLIVEAGRTALALNKVAVASGGVSAAMLGAAAATKAFILANLPITVILAAVTAAYLVLTKVIGDRNAEVEKENKQAEETLTLYKKHAEALIALREARGDISTVDARMQREEESLGRPLTADERNVVMSTLDSEDALKQIKMKAETERAFQEANIRRDKERRDAELQNIKDRGAFEDRVMDEIEAAEKKAQEDRKQAEREIADIRKRNADEFWESERRQNENRRKAIMDFEIAHGLKNPSDAINDPVAKRLAQFNEQREALRSNAAQNQAPGFGIGTVASTGFRFGSGAFGSVIGQQTEQAKTNDLLKSIDEETKAQAANIAIIARSMTATGVTPFSLGVPFSGLPGL